MAACAVWLARWLYLSIVKTDGQSGKQFPILDFFHQSETYLVMIGDVRAPVPLTAPIRLFRKTVKNALLKIVEPPHISFRQWPHLAE